MKYQNKLLNLFIYLAVILDKSVFRTGKHYFIPKRFQKNVNLLLKNKNVTGDIENYSGDFDSEDTKEEIFREENYDEDNFVEAILNRIAEDHSDFKRFIRYPFDLHNSYDKVNF